MSKAIVLGRACNTTTPLPAYANCNKLTGVGQDCAYSENDNEPGRCYSRFSTISNKDDVDITCIESGVWCPINFIWNEDFGRCEPVQELCDYGFENETQHNCQTNETLAQPGFMNDLGWCLEDFSPPGESGNWSIACCEFLRVPLPGQDYLFFGEKEVLIY